MGNRPTDKRLVLGLPHESREDRTAQSVERRTTPFQQTGSNSFKVATDAVVAADTVTLVWLSEVLPFSTLYKPNETTSAPTAKGVAENDRGKGVRRTREVNGEGDKRKTPAGYGLEIRPWPACGLSVCLPVRK